MGISKCCQKVEDCLAKAREARSREERRDWVEAAAAWIDFAEEMRARETAALMRQFG